MPRCRKSGGRSDSGAISKTTKAGRTWENARPARQRLTPHVAFGSIHIFTSHSIIVTFADIRWKNFHRLGRGQGAAVQLASYRHVKPKVWLPPRYPAPLNEWCIWLRVPSSGMPVRASFLFERGISLLVNLALFRLRHSACLHCLAGASFRISSVRRILDGISTFVGLSEFLLGQFVTSGSVSLAIMLSSADVTFKRIGRFSGTIFPRH